MISIAPPQGKNFLDVHQNVYESILRLYFDTYKVYIWNNNLQSIFAKIENKFFKYVVLCAI